MPTACWICWPEAVLQASAAQQPHTDLVHEAKPGGRWRSLFPRREEVNARAVEMKRYPKLAFADVAMVISSRDEEDEVIAEINAAVPGHSLWARRAAGAAVHRTNIDRWPNLASVIKTSWLFWTHLRKNARAGLDAGSRA